jgi:hypothetical protein
MTEQEKDIRTMLIELEQKLQASITAAATALTVSIAQLTEAHHKAQIEQEKRNSSFAERGRVDDLARRLDRAEGQLDRVGRLELAIDKLVTSIDQLEAKTSAYSLKLLGGLTSYLILLLINMSSVIITFLLTRGHV